MFPDHQSDEVLFQFDYLRLHGANQGCPCDEDPLAVDDNSAKLLAEQFRKKAEITGNDYLLVTMGNDLRNVSVSC